MFIGFIEFDGFVGFIAFIGSMTDGIEQKAEGRTQKAWRRAHREKG